MGNQQSDQSGENLDGKQGKTIMQQHLLDYVELKELEKYPILIAIFNGDIDKVKELCETEGFDVNEKFTLVVIKPWENDKCYSALRVATEVNNPDIVKYLVSRGAKDYMTAEEKLANTWPKQKGCLFIAMRTLENHKPLADLFDDMDSSDYDQKPEYEQEDEQEPDDQRSELVDDDLAELATESGEPIEKLNNPINCMKALGKILDNNSKKENVYDNAMEIIKCFIDVWDKDDIVTEYYNAVRYSQLDIVKLFLAKGFGVNDDIRVLIGAGKFRIRPVLQVVIKSFRQTPHQDKKYKLEFVRFMLEQGSHVVDKEGNSFRDMTRDELVRFIDHSCKFKRDIKEEYDDDDYVKHPLDLLLSFQNIAKL